MSVFERNHNRRKLFPLYQLLLKLCEVSLFSRKKSADNFTENAKSTLKNVSEKKSV